MLNKIKKIKLSKSKYIYTVIAGLIIIAIGFTFAWWRWSSDINAIVNGQVCAPEIVFVGGSTINGHDLLPVRTKEEGLTKDIQVNLENLCDNDTAVLNLNLKPDIFPEGLSDPSFKWALYEVTTEEVQGVPTETLTYVNDGNFNGKRQYVNDNDLIKAIKRIQNYISAQAFPFDWLDEACELYNPETEIDESSLKDYVYFEGNVISSKGDFPATKVPNGCYFVMGDNRNHSDDSRSPYIGGPVKNSDIIGPVKFIYFPFHHIGPVKRQVG